MSRHHFQTGENSGGCCDHHGDEQAEEAELKSWNNTESRQLGATKRKRRIRHLSFLVLPDSNLVSALICSMGRGYFSIPG